MIEPVRESELPKVEKPLGSSGDRQPPPRRHPQPRKDSIPAPKTYGPDGNVESEEGPHIDLVG